MRLPFRRKEKKGDDSASNRLHHPDCAAALLPPPSRASAKLLAQLPPALLQRLFADVCPHARDESYATCEESADDDGCMLCHLRDLAHCAQVSRAWRANAMAVLYHSIRIDPVHYCSLEAFLAEKRKKRSRFDRNGIPEDPALARLRLLRRTVRDDPTRIGKLVHFLKTPYMIRESCHVELAQTIAVLPNLRYVDLPEGMFSDETTYATLRLEVQARCPNLRKMTYAHGSERSFALLASGNLWSRLEVLELDRITVDPMLLQAVLASLPHLRALKVTETVSIADEVMASADGLTLLPPLEELVLKDTPRVTTTGLVDYLSRPETRKELRVLTLKDTGVQPSRLQELLTMTPSLRTLAIQAQVSEPFPAGGSLPLLASRSLKTLRFEISPTRAAGPYATSAYYAYVSSSILSGGLPRLRRLYVHDEDFPNKLRGLSTPAGAGLGSGSATGGGNLSSLLLPPPPIINVAMDGTPTAGRGRGRVEVNKRFSSNNPFAQRASTLLPTQTLEVFTKSEEDGKWNFARIDSLPGSESTARRRPVSSYGLAADVAGQGWDRAEARRSVMIGDGIGGFMALSGSQGEPTREESGPRGLPEWSRPHSGCGESARIRRSWR